MSAKLEFDNSTFASPRFPLKTDPRLGRFTAIATIVLLAVLLGGATSFVALSPVRFLLIAIGFAITLPLALRVVYRPIDPLEPLLQNVAIFAVFFLARPAYDFSHKTPYFVGFDVSSHFFQATLAGLVIIVSFYIGYESGAGERIARRVSAPPKTVNEHTILICAVVLTGLSMCATLLRLMLAGGISTVFNNRGQQSENAVNVPIISEAFMVALPALLLFWSIKGQERKLARLLSGMPLFIILLSSIPGGNRRYLLPLVAAIGVQYYFQRETRPKMSTVIIAAVLGIVFVVVPLETSRTGQISYTESLSKSLTHIGTATSSMMKSQSTAMVNTLALEMQHVGFDKEVPWHYGIATLTETALQPIPRQVWLDKPETIRNEIIQSVWGMKNGTCLTICPTFGPAGTFYADFGFIGIGIGVAALGAFFRACYSYSQIHRQNIFAQMFYSALFLMPLLVWRGSVASLTVMVLIYGFPILIAAWISATDEE